MTDLILSDTGIRLYALFVACAVLAVMLGLHVVFRSVDKSLAEIPPASGYPKAPALTPIDPLPSKVIGIRSRVAIGNVQAHEVNRIAFDTVIIGGGREREKETGPA